MRPPAKTVRQSGPVPVRWRRQRASTRVASSARSRLWVPMASGTTSCAMVLSTESGPISRKRVAPSAASVVAPSWKRTASRTWRTQYSGSVRSSAIRPVTLETTGSAGSWKVRPASTSRKGSSMGSMRCEWKACDTFSRVLFSAWAATARTASSSPETTTERAPLTAAMSTPSVRSPRTSASVARRDTIAPPAGRSCMRRPRAATRVTASFRSSTPATWAATISPMECPASRSGRTPQCSSRRWRAVSKVNSAAWVYTVRCSGASAPSASSSNMTSRSGRSRCSSKAAQISSKAAANTGKAACRVRPMPGRWEPCPENRTARRPGSGATTGARVPSATSRRAASSSSRSRPVTAARWVNRERVVASEWPTSYGSRSPAAASSRSACRCTASAPLPESSHGTTGRPARGGALPSSSVGGASSRTVCALVPEMPKDEMPARRGRPSPPQGRGSVSSSTSPALQSTAVLGVPTCRVLGRVPWRIAMTILMTAPTPAAAWAWPMLDLMEPSHSGRPSGRSCP